MKQTRPGREEKYESIHRSASCVCRWFVSIYLSATGTVLKKADAHYSTVVRKKAGMKETTVIFVSASLLEFLHSSNVH